MNSRNLLLGFFSCLLFSSLSAQDGFNLRDLHKWSQGKAAPVEEVNSPVFDSSAYYRLTNQWQGAGKSLDILNDKEANKPILAKTGNYTGQLWKITAIGEGYYRLSTQWQGEGKSLDILNDKAANKPILAKTGNYTGQFWKITAVGDGFYRLSTQWKGEGKSLDIVNDKAANKPILAETGNYAGQLWKITKME